MPNALTMGRLVMTLILLGMVLYAPMLDRPKPSGYLLVVFIMFVVTAMTDIVDGYIARKFEVTSKFGRIADPLADKVLVCGAFLCFAIVSRPVFANLFFYGPMDSIIRWGAFAVITAREVWVTIARHIAESRGINFGAKWSGKLKMFLQSFGIGTVLIKWAYTERAWADWFTLAVYILIITVTIYSGIAYSLRKIK